LPQNIIKINYTTQRKGDIETSLANINKSKKNLKYFPIVQFEKGLKKTIKWIIDNKW
jgi:dTDP-D-glucose 4,6-dehydratase